MQQARPEDPIPAFSDLRNHVLQISGDDDFEHTALQVFRYQYHHNNLYRTFCNHLRRTPDVVFNLAGVPFLPLDFFRYHRIVTETPANGPALEFISSGTTGSLSSKHIISDPSLYRESYLKGFEIFFGDIEQYTLFGLLPSYLEREGSSLVYMVEGLIKASGAEAGGFYLHQYGALEQALRQAIASGRKVMLIGVSYALLDFCESVSGTLPELRVVETGGMKGRRKEMVKEEFYQVLQDTLEIQNVISEYGMTEMCSQAWSMGKGLYRCPPWIRTMVREINDPFHMAPAGKTGGLNIIDLANLTSCAFLATQDLGRMQEDGTFEVLGRFDHSVMRGCNLMMD